MATPGAVNFMAMRGRGLVCLALTQARMAQLGLKPMVGGQNAGPGTAFHTSIEAFEGVTTGISAADRVRTIAVAINSDCGPDDIVTPGHVFPLTANEGGVLLRAGQTEASVDTARLAGLNPSAVICEELDINGNVAGFDDLVQFADDHAMKIGTVSDLIAFRRRPGMHGLMPFRSSASLNHWALTPIGQHPFRHRQVAEEGRRPCSR